jgi:hypothetical protein
MAYRYRFFLRPLKDMFLTGDVDVLVTTGLTKGTIVEEDSTIYFVVNKEFESEAAAVEFFLRHAAECRISHIKMVGQ